MSMTADQARALVAQILRKNKEALEVLIGDGELPAPEDFDCQVPEKLDRCEKALLQVEEATGCLLAIVRQRLHDTPRQGEIDFGEGESEPPAKNSEKAEKEPAEKRTRKRPPKKRREKAEEDDDNVVNLPTPSKRTHATGAPTK